MSLVSHIGYVKQKGTCTKCKKAKCDSLIKQGELFWTKNTGSFDLKFHFDCYIPKNGKWAAEKLTDAFLAEVMELRPQDQIKVPTVFEGQAEECARIQVLSAPLLPLQTEPDVGAATLGGKGELAIKEPPPTDKAPLLARLRAAAKQGKKRKAMYGIDE